MSKKKQNGLPAVRIADFHPLRHYRRLVCSLIGLMFLLAFSTVKGQDAGSNSASNNSKSKDFAASPKVAVTAARPGTPLKVELSERDLSDTINSFKANDPKTAVANFRAKMPTAVTDAKTREDILRQLPAQVKALKIEDPEPAERFRKVIAPVLELYGREKVYDIIVFRHQTPIMFSDTGVVLAVSSGMIDRAASDDELLGFVAHEIGHEYFAPYSIYSKHLLKIIAEGGNERALKSKLAEALALIELQCDAFASLTLSYLNRQSLAFIEAMERIGRDFPNHAVGFHPADAVRQRIVTEIIPARILPAKPEMSSDLQALKNLCRRQRAQTNEKPPSPEHR